MTPRLFVLLVLLTAMAAVVLVAPYRARSGPLERGLDELLVGLQYLHPAAYTEYGPPAAAELPSQDDTGLVEAH